MTKIANLAERLQEVEIHSSPHLPHKVVAERAQVQEEKESTERCLAICTKALDYISELQTNLVKEFSCHLTKRLQASLSPNASDEHTSIQECLKEEEESTKQCLTTCAKALEYIGQLQSNLSEQFYHDIVQVPEGLMSPQLVTASTLQNCTDIANVTIVLEKHTQEISRRLQALSVGRVKISDGDGTVRINVFEDVLAAKDAHQVIVSSGTLISATRVTAEVQTRQWLGQISDGTLQRLSYDRRSHRAD